MYKNYCHFYNTMREHSLMIYHASAGTGKTFTLVKNYLSLVLQNESTFRNILAVTFTNKATTEMKERIIRVLSGLSRTGLPEHEQEKAVQEARLYLEQLAGELQADEVKVRKKADRILRLILHEYPAFSVQTIDSFFQRVLRGFARELDLPFTYEMEFDEDLVLGEVIDMLLLHAGDEPSLLEWLIRMMEELGDDTGNWDIRKLLMQQGRNIFTETFKSLPPETLRQMTGKTFLREYLSDLSAVITSFEKKMKEFGLRGLELFRQHGVEVSDFSYKENGVAGIFAKLAGGRQIREGASLFGKRFLAALDDAEQWLPGGKKNDPLLRPLAENHLQPLIREIYAFYQLRARDYYTARVIRRRLYTLGIMADLRQQLFQWMKEQNRMLISETGTFLHEIIGGNEVPFIYEKVGQYYSHYMIDEFQDTSRIQYEDLKPLLYNSMAAGGASLIVGDIKQSLYRWRNGDWEIMHRDIYRDLSLDPGVKRRLKVNFRSREEVVRFNNIFFLAAGEELWKMYSGGLDDEVDSEDTLLQEQQEVLRSIYAREEVEQEVPEGVEGGYVAVRLMGGDGEEPWRERALEESAALIDRLIGREGWSPGTVLVLVRSNRDGREVVRYLLERQQRMPEGVHYPVVSQDSLYLAASVAVRFLVTFLKYLTDPSDLLNFSALWHLYVRLQQPDGTAVVPPLHSQELEKIPPAERIWLFLDRKENGWLSRLMTHPLPEAVQQLVSRFGLHQRREEVPFLHTFQNYLNAFVNREGSGAVAFLAWWDEEGWQESVQLPEEVDAVRVLTIHMAKGLGAPVVIMPFADWDFEQHSGGGNRVLWCRPEGAPFNKAPVVPVEYNKLLLKSWFAEDFLRERFSAYLDNLNLLYVACTRARDRLYLFAPEKKGRDLSALLVSTLERIVPRQEGDVAPERKETIRRPEENLFVAGMPQAPSYPEELPGVDVTDFPAGTALERLRIAGKGREYFLLEKGGQKERIDRGTLYHTLLAGVIKAEDVEKAVAKAVNAGLVPAGEKEKLTREVASFLKQEGAAGWFDGSWQVRTEAEVILPGGKTLRPDRVMIRGEEAIVVDYKFGESEEDAYIRQIKKYMDVLKKMGYKRVTGVVWYVMLGKMKRIDD
jgi:ATP-dependent exoDNAse (exonuclease V) beta subunit